MAFVGEVQLRRQVQRQVWLIVSVIRKGLQTLVKSFLELQRQTLRRRRCHSLNLSVPHDHDENYRGTGHPMPYRVHPKAPAHQCETQQSSPMHSTETKMRRSNQ